MKGNRGIHGRIGSSCWIALLCLLFVTCLSFSLQSNAGSREQARRIHDRLAGVPPSDAVLQQMEDAINGVGGQTILDAADIAMNNPAFYAVTLKNIVAPWTNRDQDIFVPLNDYIATYIGLVRDQSDFRRILYDDVIYVGNNAPAYSNSNNGHYEALENSNTNLAVPANLFALAQSDPAASGLNTNATAGVMTSRAGARAFFADGTNRAMLRYTVLNHLCYDMEQLKDTTRPADRIRQDISRTPGGDSRLFMNNCVGCHAGMDPLAQAYAYYQWDYSGDPDTGNLRYTPGTVEAKYFINATTFPHGFVTPDDRWDNFWREGINKELVKWDTNNSGLQSGGYGPKSLGIELANSEAFARCHVSHAFKAVCLREPADNADVNEISRITGVFKSNNYNLKRVFAETASYCAGN
ncbi:MAG: hypothetical protein HKO60_11360 [Pseudomonadales bacterium]|nr:hypothetical protein [Pseudomonadales bacterium]NNM12509.1 hypothetical protein [Pseudomonadales bacterium]RZV59539.1 MAG: hypothetical protein EX270_01435 [Pseudomonadales bacterium]